MSVLFRALNRMAHNQTDKKAAAASFVRLAPQSTHGKKHLKLLKGRRSALIGFGLALWFAIILVASLYIIDLMGFGGVLVDDPLNAPSSQIADQPSALFEEANAIHIDPATTEESEPVLALIDASEDSMLPATPTEANVGAADLLREIVAADPRYGEAAEQLDEILSGMDSSAPVESIVAPESAVTPESAQVSEPFGIVVEMVKPSADIETQLQTASKAVSAGRYDIALQIYRSLLDRDPDDTRFIMGRAVALQKMGQTSAAIRAYQRVIVVDPDNFVALTNLLGLIGRNSPRAALSELITLVDKYPDQDMIAAQIGFTYAELGDSENALKNLRWAAKLAPGNPTYQMNVAVLFDQKGNTTMAATHYRNTLKLAELGNDNDSLPIETIKARLNYLTGTR